MFTKPPTFGIVDPCDFALEIMHGNVEELLSGVLNIPVGCVKNFEDADPP